MHKRRAPWQACTHDGNIVVSELEYIAIHIRMPNISFPDAKVACLNNTSQNGHALSAQLATVLQQGFGLMSAATLTSHVILVVFP